MAQAQRLEGIAPRLVRLHVGGEDRDLPPASKPGRWGVFMTGCAVALSGVWWPRPRPSWRSCGVASLALHPEAPFADTVAAWYDSSDDGAAVQGSP